MWHKKRNIQYFIFGCSVLFLTGCTKGKQAEKKYEEGLNLLKEENYNEAISNFQAAIDTKQEENTLSKAEQILNKKVSYALGVTYYKQGEYKKASNYFKEAVDIPYLEAWDEEIVNYQIDTLCALTKYKEAYLLIHELRAEDKKEFSLLFREYFILDALGKEKEKEAVLNEGLSIKGHGKEYRFNRAKIQYFLGNLEEAKTGMEEAFEEKIEEANLYLGQIYEKKESYKEAISYYERYKLDAIAENDFVNLRIASCYEKGKDYESALIIYEEAIKNSDGSYLRELRYNQIIALEEMSQFQEAFEKCSDYMTDYKEDDAMKKELAFLETRV